jgi:hypothetical protein
LGERQMILNEIAQAIEQLKIAEERFNDAIGDEIEIAIYELKAAELRLNMLLREVKEAKKKVTA